VDDREAAWVRREEAGADLDLAREPDVVLVAEGNKRRGAGEGGRMKVLGAAEVAFVLEYARRERSGRRERPGELERSVARAVVGDDDLRREDGLCGKALE
jgi:hypothetical protein